MTRSTPALLLLLALSSPARAQPGPTQPLEKSSKEKLKGCESALEASFHAERAAFKDAAPEGKSLDDFWKEQCGRGKDPAEIAAGLRKPPADPVKSRKDAEDRESASKKIDGLSGKVSASLGRGQIGELYGERDAAGGGVAAMPLGGLAAKAPPLPNPPAADLPYAALYSGLDARSAAFWKQASVEIAGNPVGKELLDKFAAQGAPLPKLVVQKINTSSYDMAYQYGRNEMVVGTRFLKEYGLTPADLDDPAKAGRFIRAASPLLYHETDHAWADVQFPRKTPGISANFGREINAYAEEMSFIHYKAKKDPAWAESKLAQGFMAQYDAYLEDPTAFMDKTAKSPGYRDMPSMETMRKKVTEELALEGKRPKRKYPGLEEDLKSLETEIRNEEKTVLPSVNASLFVMRAEKAVDNAEAVPSPQALDKLTLARKRLGSIPAYAREDWNKKIDAAGTKVVASEAAAVRDSLKDGNPAYGDQSLRALEDWSAVAGSKVPDGLAAKREEVYRAGIKKNLEYADKNALAFKRSRGEEKSRYKRSIIYTLNEARADAARLGLDIDKDLEAVIKKAGL